MKVSGKPLDPYLGGVLAGSLVVLSVWMSGKFFGASTTFVRAAGFIESVFRPGAVTEVAYYAKEGIKIEWQWMFVCGVLLGSLISSLVTGTFRLQAVPDTWKRYLGQGTGKRAVMAFLGGVLAMVGARMADGCPSGHGLSGVMQLAVSSLLALVFFFLGGVVTARMTYKQGRGK